MKHLHSFDELRQINRKIVYALGTFDGVHRGHQRVIGNAIAEAKAHDAVTVLVTFSAHPMTMFQSAFYLLILWMRFSNLYR